MTDKQLRFAPLVRVSTEEGEKRGESLRTQKAQIERAVKSLGGVLIPDAWRYSGQEHATPEFEHRRFDQLLKDAPRNIFDAVIVWDPSRWSRDNLKSKQGIQILKQAGVRFFILQMEQNLFDPTQAFLLNMTVELSEYQAMLSTQKSVLNRIARASRSVPTSGNLPYGRTFDKKTEAWGVDRDKQKKIAWAADQFLKGDRLDKLAPMLDLHPTTLWKILTQRCGDSWEVRFRSNRLSIDEKVTLKVPALLPPETIRRIKERIDDHKGIKAPKHQYLLSRRVFCKRCGKPMFGQCNHSNVRYYREERGCPEEALWCPANELEQIILVRLFAVLGDKVGLEAAMLRTIPDRKKVEELKGRRVCGRQ